MLSKARQVDELAVIVKDILIENIQLKQETVAVRTGEDDHEEEDLVICKLSCDERLNLAKKTL